MQSSIPDGTFDSSRSDGTFDSSGSDGTFDSSRSHGRGELNGFTAPTSGYCITVLSPVKGKECWDGMTSLWKIRTVTLKNKTWTLMWSAILYERLVEWHPLRKRQNFHLTVPPLWDRGPGPSKTEDFDHIGMEWHALWGRWPWPYCDAVTLPVKNKGCWPYCDGLTALWKTGLWLWPYCDGITSAVRDRGPWPSYDGVLSPVRDRGPWPSYVDYPCERQRILTFLWWSIIPCERGPWPSYDGVLSPVRNRGPWPSYVGVLSLWKTEDHDLPMMEHYPLWKTEDHDLPMMEHYPLWKTEDPDLPMMEYYSCERQRTLTFLW